MDTSRRSGILLVDKPGGMTSHDVVARTRKLAATRRVGHAGTLDPMATGLLILGVNGATRLLTFLVGLDKEYLATIRLGGSTPTDDADSPVDEVADPARIAAVTDQHILEAIRALTGAISQVPSTVSAIKVDGQRAYARVRAGETVELKPREVTVSAFEVLEIRHGDVLDVDVRVECSTGTYVRALARDLGRALGVGGYLTALRRTRVGPFHVSEATALDDLDVAAGLQAPADIAGTLFPVIELSPQHALDLSHGKRVDLAGQQPSDGGNNTPGPVAAIAPDGRLLGLVAIEMGIAKSIINFPEEVGTS
ncbi:MAG: tRNA pseudouridine(55) synthase TruB [Microbacteriaceae bacterium]|nr:tRNA pseudouridine(55) synthase TruB [Microbacteriaceae bacterium]